MDVEQEWSRIYNVYNSRPSRASHRHTKTFVSVAYFPPKAEVQLIEAGWLTPFRIPMPPTRCRGEFQPLCECLPPVTLRRKGKANFPVFLPYHRY